MSEAFVWFHNYGSDATKSQAFYEELLGCKPPMACGRARVACAVEAIIEPLERAIARVAVK